MGSSQFQRSFTTNLVVDLPPSLFLEPVHSRSQRPFFFPAGPLSFPLLKVSLWLSFCLFLYPIRPIHRRKFLRTVMAFPISIIAFNMERTFLTLFLRCHFPFRRSPDIPLFRFNYHYLSSFCSCHLPSSIAITSLILK